MPPEHLILELLTSIPGPILAVLAVGGVLGILFLLYAAVTEVADWIGRRLDRASAG